VQKTTGTPSAQRRDKRHFSTAQATLAAEEKRKKAPDKEESPHQEIKKRIREL